MPDQNFKNHTQFVPVFHYVTLPLLLLVIVGAVVNLVNSSQQNLNTSILIFLLSIVTLLVSFFARIFALKAQDRAIKAEENFRHFIATGKPLDKAMTTAQIVALRFAGNEEFVALAQKAVTENMSSKEIKMAIQNWRGDYNRV